MHCLDLFCGVHSSNHLERHKNDLLKQNRHVSKGKKNIPKVIQRWLERKCMDEIIQNVVKIPLTMNKQFAT